MNTVGGVHMDCPPFKRRKLTLAHKKRIVPPQHPYSYSGAPESESESASNSNWFHCTSKPNSSNVSINTNTMDNSNLTEDGKIQFLVFGYIHTLFGDNKNTNNIAEEIPSAIKFLCLNFYGYAIKMCSKILNSCQKRLLFDALTNKFQSPNNLLSCNAHIFGNQSIKFSLLYRASRDGFLSSDFHRLCDGKPNTLTIIKSNFNCVFGGFVRKPWTVRNTYICDAKSFLFSVSTHRSKQQQCQIFDIKSHLKNYAVYHGSKYGPCFGKKFDIFLGGGGGGGGDGHNSTQKHSQIHRTLDGDGDGHCKQNTSSVFYSYCSKRALTFKHSNGQQLCGCDLRFQSPFNLFENIQQQCNFSTVDYEVFQIRNISEHETESENDSIYYHNNNTDHEEDVDIHAAVCAHIPRGRKIKTFSSTID